MKKIIGIIGGLALAVFTFTVGSNTLTSSDITLSNLVNMDVAKAFDGEYDDFVEPVKYDELVLVEEAALLVKFNDDGLTYTVAEILAYRSVTCEGTGDVSCVESYKEWENGTGPLISINTYPLRN